MISKTDKNTQINSVIRYYTYKYIKCSDLSVIRSSDNLLLIKYKESSKAEATSECNNIALELNRLGCLVKIEYCSNYTIKISW